MSIVHLAKHVAPRVRVVIAVVRCLVRKEIARRGVRAPIIRVQSKVAAEAVNMVKSVTERNLLPIVAVFVVNNNIHRGIRAVVRDIAMVITHVIMLPDLNAALQQVDRQLAVAHIKLTCLVDIQTTERTKRLGTSRELNTRCLLRVVGNRRAKRGVESEAGREHPHRGGHPVTVETRLILLMQDFKAAEVLLHDREFHHLALAEFVPRRTNHRVALLPLALVLAAVEERRNNIVVVRLLHRLRDLLNVQQVLATALVRRHKTVLQHKRKAMPDRVVLTSFLATSDETRNTLLRHNRGESLVKTEFVPRHVELVGDLNRKGNGRVPVIGLVQETLDRVTNENVLADVRVGESVRFVLVLVVRIGADFPGRWTKKGMPVVCGGARHLPYGLRLRIHLSGNSVVGFNGRHISFWLLSV